MFDLFRSRDKAVRYVLGGMLMLVALSMVVTLIPGFGSATSSDDQVIAEVGKDVITLRQVQTELQNLVRNRQVPGEMLQIYAPQFIDQMIMERAVSYQAERMGFNATDTEVAASIRSVMPQMFNNGQLIDKSAYERLLADRGMTIPEFENMVRKQILMGRLQSLVMEGIVVTPQEIQAQFEKANLKVKVDYIMFKPDSLKSAVTVTPADLDNYYKANQNLYMEPEKRNIALLIADQEKIAASINVSDEQLKQAYNARRDQYRTPERVRARHILLKTTGKSAGETATIKQKAEDLLKQLKAGGNFAELAKKNSEDTGSGAKGGELGWIVKGQMVPNFEAAVFSLPVNKISDLVTTEYGFHIVQVEEKQEAHTQTLDEVRGQLSAELKKQVVFERMQSSIEQARAALQKAPANLDAVANQYNLELVRVDKAGPGQALPQIGSVPDLDAAFSGLRKGDVTQVFQAPGDKLVVAQVLDTFPAHVQPMAEVEARVKDAVTSQKSKAMAADRANQALTRIKAGEDMAKVAKELGAEVKTSSDFNSKDVIEGLGSANMFADAFAKPAGAFMGPLPAAGDASVVAKTVSKTPADPSQLAAQRDGILQEIKQKKAAERRELFYDSILASLIKSGKVKKHKTVIDRLIASYHS